MASIVEGLWSCGLVVSRSPASFLSDEYNLRFAYDIGLLLAGTRFTS